MPADAITPEALAQCLATLQQASALSEDHPTRQALERAVHELEKSGKKRRKIERRQKRSQHNQQLTATTTRAQYVLPPDSLAIRGDLPDNPGATSLMGYRRCYICHDPYQILDPHYHLLCPPCAALNHQHRYARTHLHGRRAILTGGRIKIGFVLACMLLRDGAHLTITTRFPADAQRRFAALPDASDWSDRLSIIALDFLNPASVINWAKSLTDPIDILIHNAAQTVKRPPEYYQELLSQEPQPLIGTSEGLASPLFPRLQYDEEGLPLDLRTHNSWVARLDEVSPTELVEAHLINAIVPALLDAQLKPLLQKSPIPDRYIIHVSAVEGQFIRRYKSPNHPHTNMAKAALNMLTRTSAQDYQESGIYMTSVDTGWVTNENPHLLRQRQRESGFVPPLDIQDGAARIYHPIVHGQSHPPHWGVFLQHYQPAPW